MNTKRLILLAVTAIFAFAAGCAGIPHTGAGDDPQIIRQGNAFYLPWQNIDDDAPIITISQDFDYGGAEIVPSPEQKIKRHIFSGPKASFVTVTAMRGTPKFIRDSVTNRNYPSYEFGVQEITGPEWIRIVGNKTPCCTNLLRSQYLFVPSNNVWDKSAPLPDDELAKTTQGYVLIISYAEPMPENPAPYTWTKQGTELLSSLEQTPKLDYDATANGLINPHLGPQQRDFLTEQTQRATKAYVIK